MQLTKKSYNESKTSKKQWKYRVALSKSRRKTLDYENHQEEKIDKKCNKSFGCEKTR